MSWRTVEISSRCKLDTKMGYMVIRGEDVRRIFLDEIAVVIVENPAVAMTGCLLSELIDRKVKVIHFDLNRTALLNKVCAAMEQTAVSEEFFLKTAELLSTVESYVDTLSFELPGDIVCEKCSVAGILKGIRICLRDDYDDPLEKLLDFMELVRAYDRDKLFVIQGMRSFFGDSRVELFLKAALSHGYRVLLLDGIARKKLPGEKRLTIDNDLCEY